MKKLYNELSQLSSALVTKQYSTSFFSATKMLHPRIQPDIHNIYGFVRLADEIVDTFHDWDQEELLNRFEKDTFDAIEKKISLNPILHSLQITVNKYAIDHQLIVSFLKSMRMDLSIDNYTDKNMYNEYIYGSADVVGLMCLHIFCEGDKEQYEKLKPSAMRLGSAFQKVNFLRDLKQDTEELNRKYFTEIGNTTYLDFDTKEKIIAEIEDDFKVAYEGIKALPEVARGGVHTAYLYYLELLKKLKKSSAEDILSKRIRVNNINKFFLLVRSYFNNRTLKFE